MELRTARLCLDCEAVHEEQQCPRCTSEVFAYLTRWVQPAEPPAGPKMLPKVPPRISPDIAVYQRLSGADTIRPKATKLLKRGAIGLTVIGLARWAWRQTRPAAVSTGTKTS